MKTNFYLIGGTLLIVGLIIGGIVLFSSGEPNQNQEKQEIKSFKSGDPNAPKIDLAEKTYNFSEIDAKIDVKYGFKFKNTGKSALQISDVTSSCACTTASILIGEKKSASFGMHAPSENWIGEVAPGQEGVVEAIFDANYHKGAQGPVTRSITFQTNDPQNKKIELILEGSIK